MSEVASWAKSGHLRSAIDASADCVMALDLKGQLVLINKAGLGLAAIQDFALIEGRHWSSFWPETTHENLHAGLATASRGGQYRFDARAPLASGGSKEWNVLISPLRGPSGEIEGFLTSARDASAAFLAKHEAEARAHAWEKDVVALRAANRIAQLGAWAYDCATRRVSFSPELVAMIGGPSTLDVAVAINHWVQGDRAAFARQLEEAATLGSEFVFEGQMIGSDGAVRWMRVIGEPEFAGGWCVALRGASQDITASRLAMDRLHASEQTAVRNVAAMSNFLSTMSHELRTPLNGVLGMVQAMALDELSDVQRDRLRVIRASGDALLSLLNDLLDMSKIEAGKLELEEGVVEVEALAQSIEAFAVLLQAKNVNFSVRIDEGASGAWAGDPQRVRQILHNLVANAVKFTERGSVQVVFSEGDGRLVIEVCDTGIGIAPDRVAHIFDKFVQADASVTRRFGGAGLGLSICRDVAGLMNGDIQVETTHGKGSTFTVTLPLLRLRSTPREALCDDAEPYAPVSGLRVLVAEDNPMNQQVLRTLLGAIDLEPVIVSNGEEALAAWRAASWDIILMDIQMPVLDGVSATRLIREVELTTGRARTPVIALTANAMPHHVAEYRAEGLDAVVAKPIDLAHLVQTMNAVMCPDDENHVPEDESRSESLQPQWDPHPGFEQ